MIFEETNIKSHFVRNYKELDNLVDWEIELWIEFDVGEDNISNFLEYRKIENWYIVKPSATLWSAPKYYDPTKILATKKETIEYLKDVMNYLGFKERY